MSKIIIRNIRVGVVMYKQLLPDRPGVLMPIFLIIMCLAAPVTAYSQGWYAGLNIGQTEVEGFECSPQNQVDFFNLSCDAENKDTVLKVYGGYKVPGSESSPFSAAIEFGYIDFGEAYIAGDDSIFGPALITTTSNGFNVSGVGFLSVSNELSLFAKAGLIRWQYKIRGVDMFGPDSFSDDGIDLAVGFGASLAITARISARLEWEKYEIEDEDLEVISGGVTVKF